MDRIETRNRDIVFRGLVVNIERLEVRVGGKGWHPFEIVRHPGGVGVLPLHDDGTVTLIRQIRPAAGGPLLEIPAGRLHKGEDPAACGARELAEETGLRSTALVPLGKFHSSPGVFDEVIHLFLGTGLSEGPDDPEAFEEIERVRLPFSEAVAMARDGRINDGKTVVVLFRAQGRIP